MKQTVLFDLDGTIVEHGHALLPTFLSKHGHDRSLDSVKMAVSRQIHYFYNHVAAAEEQDWIQELFRRFYSLILGDLEIADPEHSLAHEINDYFATHPVPPIFDDVLPLLLALQAQKRRLGVITQRGREGAEHFLESHGLTSVFETLIAGDDGHGRKPGSGPFLAALNQLDSSPADAVYIGDRIDDDCEGATGAGLDAFLIDRDRVYTLDASERDDFVHLTDLGQLLLHLPPTVVE